MAGISAERKRLDVGDLNPINERELNTLDVCKVKGRWNVSKDGEGDVGISNRITKIGTR
jgi:hypothetical protein